jgi:hypothetical protein
VAARQRITIRSSIAHRQKKGVTAMDRTERAAEPEGDRAQDTKKSRRMFLRGLTAGLGALGLRSLASAPAARAADGDPLTIGGANIGSSETSLDCSSQDAAFVVQNMSGIKPALYGLNGGTGPAVFGIREGGTGASAPGVFGEAVAAKGIGVVGKGDADLSTGVLGTGDIGVYGDAPAATTNRIGVKGTAAQANGIGVSGNAFGANGVGVKGSGAGSGLGVYGHSDDNVGVFGASENASAVQGNATTYTGVYGVSHVPSGGTAFAGVVGDSDSNPGVAGLSSSPTHAAGEFTHNAGGRGGLFSGDKAQARLKPSAAGTHPTRGAAGDLFVDKSHRLWFCKGGRNWKQLA